MYFLLARSIEKINRMLKTLTDDEINQVLTKVTAVAGSAEKFLSPENRNMTNHVLQDSDIALERVNKIIR